MKKLLMLAILSILLSPVGALADDMAPPSTMAPSAMAPSDTMGK